jgi:acetylcholinesterase
MLRNLNLFAFIACFTLQVLCEIVEIDDGKLDGNGLTSRLGQTYHGFFRIPYAQTPVNELRFQPPQPLHEKWIGVRDAKRPGPNCVQRGRSNWAEDCLHLNVFTKDINGSKPVIFFIHGGGFGGGSSTDQGFVFRITSFYLMKRTIVPLFSDARNLMDRDVVVVTINYRLGVYGFLSLGTKEVPGNLGMKDQVMALKWVQKNIAKFGGNKDLVTLTGFSAGGFAVTAHMASPMSKGLFHRAIAMSGSITVATSLGNNNSDRGERLEKLMKCPSGKLFECLSKVNSN